MAGLPGLIREHAASVRSVKEEGSKRENIMNHCIAASALLIVIVSGAPSVPLAKMKVILVDGSSISLADGRMLTLVI